MIVALVSSGYKSRNLSLIISLGVLFPYLKLPFANGVHVAYNLHETPVNTLE